MRVCSVDDCTSPVPMFRFAASAVIRVITPGASW